MKDYKGRECSTRHFKRGNQLVPVLIPLDWKNDWLKLNKACRQTGDKDIPEEEYWKWREEKEKTRFTIRLFRQMYMLVLAMKNKVKKLF